MLAWRSVIGAGFALPRDAGRRPAASSPGGGPLSRAILLFRGYAPRREPSHSWDLTRRGPAGRCADQSGPSCWHGAASSALVSRSRAMPVGDRRSGVVRHPAFRGPRREGSHPDGWGLCRRGLAGRCAGLKTGVPSHSRSGKERRRKKTCQARLRNGGHRNMRHTASIAAGLRIPASRRRIQRRERNRDRSLVPE